MKKVLAMAITLMALVTSSWAVTVNITANDAQGFADAVRNVSTYADAVNEIVLPEGIYVFTTAILDDQKPTDPRLRLDNLTNGKTLTIKAAAGATPVLVINEQTRALFYQADGGTLIVDGLTFVGPATGNLNLNEGVFDLEADTTGVPCTTTIKNCLFAANNGSNEAVTNYSAFVGTDLPADGALNCFVDIGEDPLRANHTVSVENCTLAMASGRAINVGGRKLDDIEVGAQRTVTISHTFIISPFHGVEINGASSKDGANKPLITIDHSCIADWRERGIQIRANAENNSDSIVTVYRTIIGPTGDSAPFDWTAGGNNAVDLRVTNSTIHRSGADQLEASAAPSGDEKLTLLNVVTGPWNETGDAIDGIVRDLGTAAIYDFENVAGFATGKGGNGIRIPESSQALRDAVAGLYGGGASGGPLQADPMFALSEIDSTFDGRLGWNSEDNALLDVMNPVFKGKGTQGYGAWQHLAGGAEAGPGVPVELSSFQVE